VMIVGLSVRHENIVVGLKVWEGDELELLMTLVVNGKYERI
jgi:hypothetical protein